MPQQVADKWEVDDKMVASAVKAFGRMLMAQQTLGQAEARLKERVMLLNPAEVQEYLRRTAPAYESWREASD